MRTPSDIPARPRKADPGCLESILMFLGGILLLVALTVGGAFLLRYAYDVVIIHAFHGAPPVSLAEAIGLSAIINYCTHQTPPDKSVSEILTGSLTAIGLFLLTVWVVHFFIPGA